MKKLMWWAAWSTYEEDFNDQLLKLGKCEEESAKDLVNYPPEKWSRAFFDTICKNQMVDNNFTESFNSWILEARGKPILKMLEDIRLKTMDLIVKHEREAGKWDDDYSPQSMDLFTAYLKIAHYGTVTFNGANGYEVTDGCDRHTVDLNGKKCTCRAWNLSGIPCPHAIKAIQHRKMNPATEIDWYHSKDAYLQIYQHKIMPVRGEKFWNILPEHQMKPPEKMKTVGRPRSKRRREKDEANKRKGEWSASRRGIVMSCSKCGAIDHNARRCNLAAEELKRSRMGHFEDGDFSQECSSSEPPPPSQPGVEGDFVFMFTPDLQMPQYVPYGPLEDTDSDLELRPQVISEAATRMQKRNSRHGVEETRVINFIGDSHGVCQPTKLPYSPSKPRYKGKNAVTRNQLEVQRQEKISKLKARRGNGAAQV